MIYLDNAATTFPKPQSVRRAVNNSVMTMANPGRSGHKFSMAAGEMIYRCRVKASDFFKAGSEENVIFTPGCTYSANMVIKGLLRSGDHVVVSDMEHNAVMRPLHTLSEKGITYTIAHTGESDEETLGNFRDALRGNTRLVICTHVSNVWGQKLPIERIAALCSQYGIPIMIDAAQSAGVFPINAEESGVDFICAPAHKGLYGTAGTGILIARKPELLRTIIEGGTGSGSISLSQPDFPPDKFESGTPNVQGIAALSAGFDFVKQTGIERIHDHEVKLVTYLYDRLSRIEGVALYTPRPCADRNGGLISFNIGDMPSEEAAALLFEKGIAVRAGLHCSPLAHKRFSTEKRGAVRVSVSYFNSLNDMENTARIVERISRR